MEKRNDKELLEIDCTGIIPDKDDFPNIDYRKLDRWCKEHNREPKTLTKEEIKMFEVKTNSTK